MPLVLIGFGAIVGGSAAYHGSYNMADKWTQVAAGGALGAGTALFGFFLIPAAPSALVLIAGGAAVGVISSALAQAYTSFINDKNSQNFPEAGQNIRKQFNLGDAMIAGFQNS